MAVANASQKKKSVADPSAAYESMRQLWQKSRAIIGGERFTKDFDGYVDTIRFSNLLLPFSPSMTQQQYDFFKAEAELPGIVAQHARIIIGGLLRKQPQLKLPKDMPKEAYDWIMNCFSQSGSPLISFLDESLWEEIQTSRCWVYVDYPKIDNPDSLSREDLLKLRPYPVIWNAESIVNMKIVTNKESGEQSLERIIIRHYEESFSENEFHPDMVDTVHVHEIVEGYYQIRKFQRTAEEIQVLVVNGVTQQNYVQTASGTSTDPKLSEFKEIETILVMCNGERLKFIPAWPLNGNTNIIEPMLMPLIDREVSLYNKISRRNHLLYGAATYTPVVASDMTNEDFNEIRDAGLGSWIKVRQGDTVTVLDTPTAALTDMDRSIASTIEEMAKLGIRMLTPETSQSGVALDIRNAAQTAQLGTLNTKISNQMASIIAFMLNWRYDLQLRNVDVEFELSADFNPAPLGADWLRLATEWYEKGLIPRSIWLQVLKQNDMLSPDYDDEVGKQEINADDTVFTNKEQVEYAAQVQQIAAEQQAEYMAQRRGE